MANPSQYEKFVGVARDANGVAVQATVTVLLQGTSTPATIYSDRGTTSISNPFSTGTDGSWTFYGPLRTALDVSVTANGTTVTMTDIGSDTVEAHRQNPEHASGSITAGELEVGIFANADEVAVHAARETNTHGVTSGYGFVESSHGATTTNSPTFATVTAAATNFATLEGATILNTGDDLAAAVTAASANSTILIAGTVTLTSTLTINKNLTIRGFPGGYSPVGSGIISATGVSGHAIQIQDSVTLENLTIYPPSGAYSGIEVQKGSNILLRDVFVGVLAASGANGIRVNESGGTIGDLRIQNCTVDQAVGAGLYVKTSTGQVRVSDCRITSNDTAGTTSQVQSDVANVTFYNCRLDGFSGTQIGFDLNGANNRILSCVVEDSGGSTVSLDVAAGATTTFAPTQMNIFAGSITDPSSNVIGLTTWDYASSITDIDNSGSTYTNEFFAQSFTHNLGTTVLEPMLLVSNNSSMNAPVWVVNPSIIHEGASRTVVAGGFSLVFTSTNTAYLTFYAEDVQNGGSPTSSNDFIFSAVDPTAPQNNTKLDAYDFSAAGGYQLKRVWVRLYLRRIQT